MQHIQISKYIIFSLIFSFSIIFSQDIDIEVDEDIELEEDVAPGPAEKKAAADKIEQSPADAAGYNGHVVRIIKDSKGFKLNVDGKDMVIKGVVWGNSVPGKDYRWSMFDQSYEYIKNVLDTDMKLLKEMGVNCIRTFEGLPPRWAKYIYEKWGMYSIVNTWFGAYGVTVNGVWMPQTPYDNPDVQKLLLDEVRNTVKRYYGTPGVIMFAWGNENNYHLEWETALTEDIPVGEKNKVKAAELYKMFNRACALTKKMAPNIPVTIVNGDLGYIELIDKYCKDLDILSANVYRGATASDFYAKSRRVLDKPVCFAEFGCDAYNVLKEQEDQEMQAKYLYSLWENMFTNSYGHGPAGNSLGGFTFAWMDGWGKSGADNKMQQNPRGQWTHPAFPDFYDPSGEGWEWGGDNDPRIKPNMNEDWWGICATSLKTKMGVNLRIPRAAYYAIQHMFKLNPLQKTAAEITAHKQKGDMDEFLAKGNSAAAQQKLADKRKFKMTGARLRADMLASVRDSEFAAAEKGNKKSAIKFSEGEQLDLSFEFAPKDTFYANVTVNLQGNVTKSPFPDSKFGDRAQPILVDTYTNTDVEVGPPDLIMADAGRQKIQPLKFSIYQASFHYLNPYFDLTGFYHVPRYHWFYEGDIFQLVPETTDLARYDIYDDNPPVGIEFTGKDILNGLKLVVGPELAWGANPQALLYYQRFFGPVGLTLIHQEEFAIQKELSPVGSAPQPPTRKTSLMANLTMIPKLDIKVGGLFASPEKINRLYSRQVAAASSDSGYLGSGKEVIFNNKISIIDTLAVKGLFDLSVGPINPQLEVTLAGLVADGGDRMEDNGSLIWRSGGGNKIEGYLQMPIYTKWLVITPRFLYRQNLVPANKYIWGYVTADDYYKGIGPRSLLGDPFAVGANRKAVIGEVTLTYDPTGVTYFHAWDNSEWENSKFAASLTFNFSHYPTWTDAGTFVSADGNTYAFGSGLPPADLWRVSGRYVVNPNRDLRLIFRHDIGLGQPAGYEPGGSIVSNYLSNNQHNEPVYKAAIQEDTPLQLAFYADVEFKQLMASAFFKVNDWGPEDWYKQFNIYFPFQWEVDVAYSFDTPSFISDWSKIGLRYTHRKYDENSALGDWEPQHNDDLFAINMYYELNF